MKKFFCILGVILTISSHTAYAKSNILGQIPNQFELIFETQRRIVYTTPYGGKYHTKDCTYTNVTDLTTAGKARAAGLTRCAVCKP